jgi:hypothetical protein
MKYKYWEVFFILYNQISLFKIKEMHIQMQILHDPQCWHQVQKTQNIFILFF